MQSSRVCNTLGQTKFPLEFLFTVQETPSCSTQFPQTNLYRS